MNTAKKLTGVSIAAAAALLLTVGCQTNESKTSNMASEAKIHCMGVNACKGTTACKTASNACKGMNSCKGSGWLPMTKEECDSKGGKITS